MPTFEPLTASRAIRDDDSLTTGQKALLWAAVLRADNETTGTKVAGQVRASLTVLANDAGLSREWVTRQVQDSPEVQRHFAKVTRRGRRTDLFLHVTSDHKETENPSSKVLPLVTSDHMHVTSDHKASDLRSHHLPTPAPTPASTPAIPLPSPKGEAVTQARPSTEDNSSDLPDYVTPSNISALVALHRHDRTEVLRLTREYDTTTTRDPKAFEATERQRLHAGWRDYLGQHLTRERTQA